MLILDLKRIGDKLQLVRKQAGLSQEEAAWQSGMSLRAYADIERGMVNPKLESILKICRMFHITPDMIMTEEESPSTLDYGEIISEIDSLPQRERYIAYKVLETIYRVLIENDRSVSFFPRHDEA